MSKENLHDELQNFTSKPNFKKQSKVDINIGLLLELDIVLKYVNVLSI